MINFPAKQMDVTTAGKSAKYGFCDRVGIA